MQRVTHGVVVDPDGTAGGQGDGASPGVIAHHVAQGTLSVRAITVEGERLNSDTHFEFEGAAVIDDRADRIAAQGLRASDVHDACVDGCATGISIVAGENQPT